MSIRSRLIWLVFAVLAPTLVFGLVATYTVYDAQWARISRSMQETTRAVALAVDSDLRRYEAIVSTVAVRPSLVRGDLKTFYQDAQEILQPFDAGVIVFDPDGVPLLNTHRPNEGPIPMPPSLPSVLGSEGLDISPLFIDSHDGGYAFAIHRPFYRDGRVVYYVSMEFPAERLGEILKEHDLPEDWLGVILDQRQTIVVRTRDPAAHVGQRATGSIVEKLQAHPDADGITESITRDGHPVLTFFSRAKKSQWTVLIAIPQRDLLVEAAKPLAIMVGGIMLTLAIALTLAVLVGRTITRPLKRLDLAAEAMANGDIVKASPTGIDETDRTASALAAASEKIFCAKQELSERVAEAVAQAERSHHALLQGQKLEALGRLTGGIAHDFNNLLQSMTVGLELAAMLSPNPRAQRALDACLRSVNRGTRLTRQLMTFSRNRNSEARLTDLRDLILGMKELLTGALPGRVQLIIELPEGRWPVVLDPLQCELAILNLAVNASDAMPDGGKLTVGLSAVQPAETVRQEQKPRPYFELKVSDTGTGMDEDIKAKAFEPFFTTKAVGAGTGLGLAQVYGFAQQSGGTVSITSAVGSGTAVSIFVPATNEGEPEVLWLESRPEVTSSSARVLVVDDDPEVRDVIASMLEQIGYSVDIAIDADSALERLESDMMPAIDLMLSDIVMPGGMDGVALAQAVRARHPDLPIVLATGYTERAVSEHGFRVLSKPFDVAELTRSLSEQLVAGQASVRS